MRRPKDMPRVTYLLLVILPNFPAPHDVVLLNGAKVLALEPVRDISQSNSHT